MSPVSFAYCLFEVYNVKCNIIHYSRKEDKAMKRAKVWIGLWLCLVLLCGAMTALADNLMITEGADLLDELVQFPFAAETNELAVNIREEASTKAKKIGQLERGTQLTVVGAEVAQNGDLFYRVQLDDDTIGYIRSDLIVVSEIAQTQREANPVPAESEIQLIGNKKTQKYHEPGCRSLPAEKNRVYFGSADEAESKGYVHCKNCD